MNRRSFFKLFPALAALHPALAVADDMDVEEALALSQPAQTGKEYIADVTLYQHDAKTPNVVTLWQDGKRLLMVPAMPGGMSTCLDVMNSLPSMPLIHTGKIEIEADYPTVVGIKTYSEVPKTISDFFGRIDIRHRVIIREAAALFPIGSLSIVED